MGQQQALIENSDTFPAWQYRAVMDNRTRPEHASLNGRVFASNDTAFFPPIGFRCRCRAKLLTASQAKKYNIEYSNDVQKKDLINATFVGNKQANFLRWLQANEPEHHISKRLVQMAINRLSKEIQKTKFAKDMKEPLKKLRQTIPNGGLITKVNIAKPVIKGIDENTHIENIVIEKSDFDKLTSNKPLELLSIIKEIIERNNVKELLTDVSSVKSGIDKGKHSDVKAWYYLNVTYKEKRYLIDVKYTNWEKYKLYNMKEVK